MKIIIIRILSYPFIVPLLLFVMVRIFIESSYKHIRYGSEYIAMNKNTKRTIAQIFTLIEENHDKLINHK
jgi:hypothetical protein